jgi:hypothetical protein
MSAVIRIVSVVGIDLSQLWKCSLVLGCEVGLWMMWWSCLYSRYGECGRDNHFRGRVMGGDEMKL